MFQEKRASGSARGGVARIACFLAPLALAVLFCLPSIVSSQAQQLPAIPSDALSQVQQSLGGRGGITSPAVDLPYTTIQQPDQPAVSNLPPSRLERILSDRAGVPLSLFGYEQLGSGRPVTLSTAGSVQDDYVLGPGDEVVASLRGQENGEFRATINRNGQFVMARLNPIPASGRTLGSFRQDLEAAVQRAYVATQVFVSLGRVRQVSVLVSGEVNNPGTRTLSGLASVVDALLLSGGVRKSGSLRNVQLERAGRRYVIDLYSVLSGRGTGTLMRLADGDRIVVPLLGPTVAVSGLVRRPAIYELPSGQRSIAVRAILALAGGQEVRGRYRLSVLRVDADGQTNLVTLPDEAGTLRDSEILMVQLAADQTINRATLANGSGLAGSYAITPGSKLSDVLRAPGALGNSPYTLLGIIVRRDPRTLLRGLMPFTPVAVFNNRENIQLQGDDTVKILSISESQMIEYVARQYLQKLAEADAALRNPLMNTQDNTQDANQQQQTNPVVGQPGASQMNPAGTNNFQQNGTQQTLQRRQSESRQAAVQTDYVTNVPAEIQRQQISTLLDTVNPNSVAALRRARQEEIRQDRLTGQAAVPSFGQGAQAGQLGQAGGYVPGQTPGVALGPDMRGMNRQPTSDQTAQYGQDDDSRSLMRSEPRNFTRQPTEAGAVPTNRDAETLGELARQLDVDPLVLINFLIDNRVRVEGAVRGPGDYLVGPGATLDDVVQATGGTVNWADESGVELVTTLLDRNTGRTATQRQTLPLRSGMLVSYVVKPHDQFRFSQAYSNTGVGSVSLQGEIRHPGTFSILRGDHLSDLLARAGGLTGVAYPYGTVFLRQSAAQHERENYLRAANEIEEQLIIAMTRVGNDKIDPSTFTSLQTFVSDLRRQQAVGRISIVADPSLLASKPEEDPLLEAGDVIYIPQRPSTVSVLGQVRQPGSYPYRANETLESYIQRAGGYSRTADESETYIVLPDGSARKVEKSWLSFNTASLPPGTSIVVPRDVTPLDLRQTIIDISQIFSQFAVAIASVAVISRQ